MKQTDEARTRRPKFSGVRAARQFAGDDLKLRCLSFSVMVIV